MGENMSSYAKYECLKVEVADKVATVTLNRPEARNAINQKLIRELRTITPSVPWC
jgi:enoyl-CoA hydratase